VSKNRVAVPTCLPIVLRRCHRCACARFRVDGTFRVTAHHELLDGWLLAPCTGCGDTAGPAAAERMNVRSASPGPLALLCGNGPGPSAVRLTGRLVRRRDAGGPGRTDRPAWQSPYGPPPHRTHRGRWVPVPGLTSPPSAPRLGRLCDRCG
jgi:hypothetical protein